MIFITAGTQEPFDRLLQVADEIASEIKDTCFIAQALNSRYKAKNFEILNFIPNHQFNFYVDNSKLIISHAGMGTIISALVKNKPIIVMPRLLKYNEHRNEHQLATAKKMDELGYVDVAYDEQELKAKFYQMWPDKVRSRKTTGPLASESLINSISNFIKF